MQARKCVGLFTESARIYQPLLPSRSVPPSIKQLLFPYLEAEKKITLLKRLHWSRAAVVSIAARVIKQLGLPVIAVYPSGGYSGKFLDHLMRKEEVRSVTIETENETRENIIIVDESANNQYRFGMPANALSEHEWKACLDAVTHTSDGSPGCGSGSMPPGVPLSIQRIVGHSPVEECTVG